MQTPFGRLPVGDAHAHFFSHRFFETLAKGLPEPPSDGELYTRLGEKLPFEFPPEDPVGLAERWVQELDTHDVSRSVLIASVPGDEESVAAAAAAHPDRFVPVFYAESERGGRGGPEQACVPRARHERRMFVSRDASFLSS